MLGIGNEVKCET